jgi:glucose-6-phosphate dehydrogenase assembly protein OpcA
VEAAVSEPAVTTSEWTDLAGVERALAELRGGDSLGSVRATTLNLVITCNSDEDAEATERVLEGIGGSRPLRAIVISPSGGKPKARVASTCWTGGGQQVCTERIVIHGARAALPSAVLSLLVADLPVFLWWQGKIPDPGDQVLEELVEAATRVIVDSDQAGIDAVRYVERLAAGLADLAWVRTNPWREAIAALFDAPRQRQALDHLVGVEVTGPPNQAALLAGWLRSRLDRQIGLDVSRAKRINRVELMCGDEPFVVERSARNEHGEARGLALAPRAVGLPAPGLVALLSGELDRLGAERPFEQALAAAA